MEEEYIPRNYQEKLIKIAVKQNSIIYLPTGSGKTFIAVCVIKELAKDAYDKPYTEGGKITVMLVNTVALVQQHTRYLQQTTPFKIGAYTGDMKVDFWDKAKWLAEYNKHQVLVMTSQIFSNTLSANITNLSNVNLLIFDECHQAVEAHAMRQIMMKFQDVDVVEQPRVLGLTATLLNGNKKLGQVLNEVKCLETTYHGKVATVDELQHVLGYSTNPKEKIEVYKSIVKTDLINYACDELNKLYNVIKQVKPPNVRHDKKSMNLPYLEPAKGFDKITRLLLDAIIHLEMLGISGGQIALICYIIHLECDKKLCADDLSLRVIDATITKLVHLKELFEQEMASKPANTRLLGFASPKVKKVVEILLNYGNESEEELCGILFVQRKNTALFLFHIISLLVKTYDNMKHIKPEYIIGFNANPLTLSKEALYYTKMNRKVVEKFKSKEVNLLIASNVIEEGVDVPRCSLVTKFDTPTNYREYIQSKGRARHQSSLYYIMVEETNIMKFLPSYQKFQTMEKELNNYLIGRNEFREAPGDREISEMYKEVPPYYVNGPNSAHVTMLSAIPILANYCGSLQADCYTNYEPTWYLDSRVSKLQQKEFKVYLELPIVCPIIEHIAGSYFRSKKDAKRATALKACIMLHKCGALDDQLAAVHKVFESAEFLFKHWPEVQEKQAGFTKKRRVYDKMIPKTVSYPVLPNTPLFLHIVSLNPEAEPDVTDIDRFMFTNLYKHNQCFGFLTAQRLPQLCKFPVYVSTGTINVEIEVNQSTVVLSDEELSDVRSFHHLIFNDILGIIQSFLILGRNPSKNIFIVPVRRYAKTIDMAVIKDCKSTAKANEPSMETKLNLVVDDDTYLKKIVTPWYRQENKQYIVLRVCEELVPKTPFPNNEYGSYQDYFGDKYNLHIFNQDQSLLWVKALSSRLNCIKPRGISKKRRKDDTFEEIQLHLIPELCVKDDIPSNLWLQAKLLPTIFHRVVQLLRCEEFRSTIATEANLGVASSETWDPLELDEYLLNYEIYDEKPEKEEDRRPNSPKGMDLTEISNAMCLNKEYVNRMNDANYPWIPESEPRDINRTLDVTLLDIEYYVRFIHSPLSVQESSRHTNSCSYGDKLAIKYERTFEPKKIHLLTHKSSLKGPELSSIYQAFTTSKCNDIVNLERLETLGDSFLKFISSLYIFLKYPKYNEGQATNLKGKLVSNKNLFYLGNKKNISGIIQSFEFTPKSEWIPPGYCVPELVNDYINMKMTSMNILYYINLPAEDQISGELSSNTIESIDNDKLNFEVSEDEVEEVTSFCCYLNKHQVPDKTIADSVEALIGVYFDSNGIEGGLKFIEWLGLLPPSENTLSLLKGPVPNPIINPKADAGTLCFLLSPSITRQVERIIGYEFNNKAFLLQALTHSSFTRNRLTYSYERLEFIGDAVLDFLITTFIYESCGRLNPGELTDLRSSLVNNEIFAAYIVKLKLDKYLLHYNSTLEHNMLKFITRQSLKDFAINDDVLILINEEDLRIAENVDVPKVLGDMFESIAGAIYLDSGMDMNKVWEVYYKIMWEEIDAFSKNIPKNPIRMLLERLAPLQPIFSDPVECTNGNLMIKLDFMLDGSLKRVHGFGDNKKTAKKAASKIALMLLNTRLEH